MTKPNEFEEGNEEKFKGEFDMLETGDNQEHIKLSPPRNPIILNTERRFKR